MEKKNCVKQSKRNHQQTEREKRQKHFIKIQTWDNGSLLIMFLIPFLVVLLAAVLARFYGYNLNHQLRLGLG